VRRISTGPGLLASLVAVARSSSGAAALTLLAGYPTLGHFQGAATLQQGTHEWTAALGAARDVRHDLGSVPPAEARIHAPRTLLPEVAWRYGWRPETDVGLRVSLGTVKGQARRRFLRQGEHGVDLAAGLGLSVFVLPLQGAPCVPAPDGGGDDGCFSSLFYGGLVDLPVTLSRRVGGLELYAGLRLGWLVATGETTYADPAGRFDDLRVGKTVRRVLGGPILGVRVDVAEGILVVPEIQVMSSRNASGGLIWYPVPGLAVAVLGEP